MTSNRPFEPDEYKLFKVFINCENKTQSVFFAKILVKDIFGDRVWKTGLYSLSDKIGCKYKMYNMTTTKFTTSHY